MREENKVASSTGVFLSLLFLVMTMREKER